MYAFAVMIGALIVGKLLTILRRKFILNSGIIVMGLSMLAFGFITYIESKVLLIIVWLAIRALQGFSSTMVKTTSYAIITIVYKDNKQKYLGILQTFLGVGMITGPLIGSTLYTFVGFQSTFFGIGATFICLVPILVFVIPNTVNIKDHNIDSRASIRSTSWRSSTLLKQSQDSDNISIDESYKTMSQIQNHNLIDKDETENEDEQVSYLKLLFLPVFFITSLIAFLSFFWYWYMEPVMSLRLDDFNLQSFWIGAFFAICPLMSTMSSLVYVYIWDKIDNMLLIFIAMFINGFSHFLIGPSPYLPNSLILMIIGQMIHGFTVTFFIVTWLPVMINEAVKSFPDHKIRVSDISSGIFSSMLGFGQMLGPIYGSYITDIFSFRAWADSVGAIIIISSIVYFLLFKWCVSNSTNRKEGSNEDTDIEDDSESDYMMKRKLMKINESDSSSSDLTFS